MFLGIVEVDGDMDEEDVDMDPDEDECVNIYLPNRQI